MVKCSELDEMQADKISQLSREALIEEFVEKVKTGEVPIDKVCITTAIKQEIGTRILQALGIDPYNIASIVRMRALLQEK